MERYTKKYLDKIEKELTTAVICDILDDLGYRNQAMSGHIKPLDDNYKLVGVAKTMLSYDVYEQPEEAYKTEIAAMDSLREGDVVVVCTNKSNSNGFWGELMATAAIVRGARGVILDGAVRDIQQLKKLGNQFKVFAVGRSPLDSKGRCLVASYDCPIICDGVMVNPGDLIFADVDGTVVIPLTIADEVFERALQKVHGENKVREELKQGALLREVYDKYQIL
jgi:regulator of RNase E activity RraA